MFVWLVFLSLTVFLCTIYYWFTRKNYFTENDIIHEKPLPFLGNSAPILLQKKSFADFIFQLYNSHKEAKYIGYYDFEVPTILIRDIDLIKAITVKHFDHFVDHPRFVDANTDPLFGRNLFSLTGDKWREIRNLLSPAFTSSKMKGMFKLMSNCAEIFGNYLAEKAETESFNINSKDAFTRYTNDVIATCAFGVAVDSMRNPDNEFYRFGKKSTDFDGKILIKFFLMRRFPGLAQLFGMRLIERKVEKFFTDLVRNTVETRDREGIVRPDMIQLMMETRNNKSDDGPNLTIEDMTAQAFLFFFAGFDSTASQICFATHLIAENSNVQEKLQKEVDEVYEKYKEDIPYDVINNMQYLDAVINESLRLYPFAIGNDRVCTKSFELPPALPGKKPVLLEEGISIMLPMYPIQRDPNYFSHPNEFIPERFIDDPQGTLHSPAYFPFGVGPRMCIANRFAMLEIKVLLYNLIAKCLLKPGKQMSSPLEFSTSSFVMAPKGGFWITLETRKKNN